MSEKFPFEESSDTKPNEATQEKVKKEPLELVEGIAAPKTVEQQYRLAQLYLESGYVPGRFKTASEVLGAMHFAKEHFPLAPMTALRQIAVIENVPNFFGDLPLAKVMASGLCSFKKEFLIDKDSKEICIANKNITAEFVAAVAHFKRKDPNGVENEIVSVFTVDDAKKAGLWEKKSYSGKDTPWIKYPKEMMKYRARSRALKDLFPDVLNGVSIGEYDHNAILVNGKVEGVIEHKDVATEINNAYLPKAAKNQKQEIIEVSEGETLRDMPSEK